MEKIFYQIENIITRNMLLYACRRRRRNYGDMVGELMCETKYSSVKRFMCR